jgi:Family of unknown function (DUF5338)
VKEWQKQPNEYKKKGRYMEKSLSKRIAERTGLNPVSRNNKNRAAFLALKSDIQQAMEDGWPVKTIWETLQEEGKIPFSYQAFRGYVNRLILGTTNTSTQKTVDPNMNAQIKTSSEIREFN